MIDLLGNVIAGRSGSYKRWVGRGIDLLERIIQRHDDAYSELEANSAESKMRGCLAYSSRNMEERLERLLSCFLKNSHRLCLEWSSRGMGCDKTSTAAVFEP